MLLQTNSYVVPKEKHAAHASLLLRFRETLARLGCYDFEIYEQVGTSWDPAQSTGRFVQIIRFHDREQQLAVQAAENSDREAQLLISEFCELINFPYQQEHGFFAVGFYTNIRMSEAASEPMFDDAEPLAIGVDEPPQDRPVSTAPKPMTMRLVSDEDPAPSDETVATDGPSEESELAKILDAGLEGDALDVPMPAELFEDEQAGSPPVELRIQPEKPKKKVSGRR